ncbi:DUF2452 domain-containing protein [bacterium]|nr:DUF2452 domain-containing protein [candidate division CSSED10-310 bacterium]
MGKKDQSGFKLPETKLPYPVRPGDARFCTLEEFLASDFKPKWVEAKREIKAQTVQKLELLESIHRELIQKAQMVIQDAELNIRLHDIRMHAAKVRGRVYYLYRNPETDEAEEFFSILTPEEYSQADSKSEFLAAYRLNEDSTWTLMTPLRVKEIDLDSQRND